MSSGSDGSSTGEKGRIASVVSATAEWGAYSGWSGSRLVTGSHEALDLCKEIEAEGDAGRWDET